MASWDTRDVTVPGDSSEHPLGPSSQAAAERRRPSEARPVGMPSYALRG